MFDTVLPPRNFCLLNLTSFKDNNTSLAKSPSWIIHRNQLFLALVQISELLTIKSLWSVSIFCTFGVDLLSLCNDVVMWPRHLTWHITSSKHLQIHDLAHLKTPPSDLQTYELEFSSHHQHHQTARCHLTIKDLSSNLTRPLLSEVMIVDWSIWDHASIGRLTHTGSHMYQAYLELPFSIHEVENERFGLLNIANRLILTMQLQLYS